MTKELEILKELRSERLYYTKDGINMSTFVELGLDVIESALKRLESVDRVGEMFCVDVDKKLKALEIIKEKKVDVIIIPLAPSCKAYNEAKTDISLDLDEKQFDLLKEVLLWD